VRRVERVDSCCWRMETRDWCCVVKFVRSVVVLDNCERREDISSRYARSFAFAGGAPVDIVIPIKPLVYQDTCVEDIKSAHTIRDNGFRHTLISSGLNHLHSLKNPVRLLSNPLLYIRNVVN